MGFFSWQCSDTNKSISNSYSKRGTFPVYVLIPEEFGGGYIEEDCYDGYGEFGGHDIYDLVADWNKKYVLPSYIKKPVREHYDKGADGRKWFDKALKRYSSKIDRLINFKLYDDNVMKEKYGESFKRSIGIDIACYDDQNSKLKYPIKITEHPMLYSKAKPSPACPHQGYFY